MTIGFGTSNICWVPEGELFRFVDLYHWAEWRIDLDRWRVALAPPGLARLREQAADGISLCRARFKGDPQALEALAHAERFAAILPEGLSDVPEDVADLALPQGPLTALWLRISDQPLESFYDEDYRPVPEETESHGTLAVQGALTLPQCDGFEIPLIGEGDDRFFLLTPTLDCVAEYPLAHDRLLPLLGEFCGYLGNSNQGRMANLRLEGIIAPENPVAVPLYQLTPQGGFATAYLHLTTPVSHTVAMPLRPSQTLRVEKSLAEQGFQLVVAMGRNGVFRRGEDWVHCLWEAPGMESEDQPMLPPVIVAAMAEGSHDPALREALLAAILQSALGHVPQPRR